MVFKVAQFFGSIKLAVPLLVSISIILIGATFYESEVGSTVVQQEIYKSPWFGALMFLLAFNLGISTLLRYPWRGARKIGFAITHWGLVVIIAGSAAVIHLSVEGMLLARTDAGPVSTLRVEGDLVEVAASGQTGASQPSQASLFIKSDGTVVPNHVGDVALLRYSDNTIKSVRFEEGATVDNPAVRLRLNSARMGQTLERWLAVAPAAYDQIDVGPATLQIVQADSPQSLKTLLSETERVSTDPWGSLDINWSGQHQSIDVASSQLKSIPFSAGQVKVLGFWPDFRLDSNRQPETASQQLRNPAVQLELTDGVSQERWFVFGNEAFEPIRSQIVGDPISADIQYEVATSPAPEAFFRVVIDPDGNLYYAAQSSKSFKSGSLTMGESVVPGWADFAITLVDYIPHAVVKREIVPLPDTSTAEQGEPALQVSVAGEPPVWVPWGEPTTLETAAGNWYVAFSPKLLQLPFALKLNDFIVERNEGSESVAMWTSAVTLMEPHTRDIVDRRVWMNHPTWFKGWKIAQASWNPGDLSQSTLQVKREPWWVTGLTWLGSLMVTGGICTMFYGRAVAKKLKIVSDWVGPVGEEDSKETVGTIPLVSFFLGR